MIIGVFPTQCLTKFTGSLRSVSVIVFDFSQIHLEEKRQALTLRIYNFSYRGFPMHLQLWDAAFAPNFLPHYG